MKNDVFKKLQGMDFNNTNGPVSIAFDVTTRCNFHCRHCYNNSGDHIIDDVSDDVLINIANQIADCKPLGVCLCGGEPLIRGDVIYELVEIISKSCGTINLVSNGWLITPEVCKRLKACGLKAVQISVDGNTPYTHETTRLKSGAFQKALDAIRIIKESGLVPLASFCPHKINYKYFYETAKLVHSYGAVEIRSMPLICMGRGSNMKELQLSPDEYLEFQQIIKKTEQDFIKIDEHFVVEWGDPIDHLYRLPNNYKVGFKSFAAEIRADGKLIVTAYLPLVIGDLQVHSLKEYWKAGFKDIWVNKDVEKYITNIYSTNQFGEFIPQAYSGEDILIDILK